MSNPIPMFGVPDTRPGYAFQDPGAGGAVAGGIQAVLAALLQRQKQEQAQAEFQLEQQRAAQNASYQNTLLAQEQARQDAARQAALAQAMGDRQVGQAVQSIGQPSTVNVQLPYNIGGGANLPMPVGPQVTPEQAMQSLDPSLVVPFEAAAKRQITDYQKAQTEAKATRQKAATETAIRGVLPGLRPMFAKVDELLAANPEADPTAVREAVVAAYGSQPDPAVLAAIDKQHPEWSHLPGAERVKLAFNYEDEKIKARFRPPSAAGTTPGNKTVTVGGVGQLSDWQSMLDATRGAREAFAALKGADATGIVTGRLADLGGQMGRPPGGTVGVVARSRLANITTALGKLRSGGAITPQEFERLQPLLPQKNEDEASVVMPKLQELEAYVASVIQRRLDALEAAGYNITEIRRSFNANAMGVRTPEMMNAELPPYRPKGMTP